MLIFLMITEDGEEIIGLIYDRYYKRMLYKATQILGTGYAEEAVQDVFLKLIEKYENNFEELRDKPGQFFVIIVRNHAINLLADKDKVVNMDDECGEWIADIDSNPETVTIRKEEKDILVESIRRLKPTPRMMLEYKYIEGRTNKEIAEILGVSQSVVSSRIDRAKKKLREQLEKEGVFL